MSKKQSSAEKEMEKMDSNEEFPKSGSSGSGTTTGYTVEARHNYHDPVTIGSQTFDLRWREVRYQRGVPGVPTRSGSPHDEGTYRTYSFPAAQALRWWLHAESEAGTGFGVCLETRLIEHKIEYKYSVTAIAAHEHAGGDGGDIPTRAPSKQKFKDA